MAPPTLLTTQLDSFISRLGSTPAPIHAFNMYSFDLAANAVRRRNLGLYLRQMLEKQPEALLVGEAPGYRGCRWTGVTFMSEDILLRGVEPVGMFGAHRGYSTTGESVKPWKEISATIVWKSLAKLKHLPVLWAAYPFHPHRPNEPLTNRPPTKEELKLGEWFIKELVAIFAIKKVIAVGNHAEATLTNLGFTVPKIRHPANGGANQFDAGVAFHLK